MHHPIESLPSLLIAELLMTWHMTYHDREDNYDARLLKRASVLLEELQDRINCLEDVLQDREMHSHGNDEDA